MGIALRTAGRLNSASVCSFMDLSGSQIPSFSVLATNRTSISSSSFFFYQYDESFTRLITNQATLCSSRAVHTKML